MLITMCCRALATLEASTGHWLCSPPNWTAYVGRPWRPINEEAFNLFNQWWRFGQWVFRHEADN
jgi:hypothetical protein